jgi:gamma-glutamylcyclotransferase (GGCT)/AIG2-like uncharacterized protein YtfP
MQKVFVYGTLLGDDSGRNYWGRKVTVFSSQHATILGSMYLKEYPYVILDGKGKVRGKVFDVDDKTLKAYDEIEGIGESWYSRVKADATLYDNKILQVWVYCFKKPRGGELVINGQFGNWFDDHMFLIPKDKGVEIRTQRAPDDR